MMNRWLRSLLDARVFRSVTALSWVVFALALVVFLVQSRHITKPGYERLSDRSARFSGDEPWYLLNVRSVAVDLDYNLHNDRAEQEFWDRDISDWTQEAELRRIGHGVTRTAEYWEERVYQTKQFGLGLVLAPAYRIGLLWDEQVRLTCVWFLCVVGALVVQQVFWFGLDVTENRWVALVGAVAGAWSMPLIAYTSQIFTELVAAFLIILVMRLVLVSTWPRMTRAIIVGICLAYLPWLHEKYYPFVLVGIVLYLVESWPWRAVRLIGFVVPLGVSAWLLTMYYRTLYGVPYPVFVHKEPISVLSGLKSGYLGLLFDRTDGLFPFWPVLAFAVVGLVLMCREAKTRRVGIWLAVTVGMLWLVYGAYPDWPGGLCPPLRYWVPVVPLLIVASSHALGRMRRRWLVVLAAMAMVYGVVVGARNISDPRHMLEDSLPIISGPKAFAARTIERAYHAFPDMKRRADGSGPTARDTARGVAWLVALAGFVVLVVWLERSPVEDENIDDATHDDRERADNNG